MGTHLGPCRVGTSFSSKPSLGARRTSFPGLDAAAGRLAEEAAEKAEEAAAKTAKKEAGRLAEKAATKAEEASAKKTEEEAAKKEYSYGG